MADLPIPPSEDSALPIGTTAYTPQWRFIVDGSYIIPYMYVNGQYQYMPTQEAIRAFFGALIGQNEWMGTQLFQGRVDLNGQTNFKGFASIEGASSATGTSYWNFIGTGGQHGILFDGANNQFVIGQFATYNWLKIQAAGVSVLTAPTLPDHLTNKIYVDGLISSSTVVATSLQTEKAVFLAAWGDSLTEGTAGTLPYPSQLSAATGFTVYNGGVGGETSTQIRTRMIADTGKYGYPTIIWAGRNNYTAPTTVKADIAAMIAALGHSNYLVLGILNSDVATEYIGQTNYNTINTLNSDLSTLYGAKFVDIRPYLVSLYNPAIPQDVTDHNNDVPPSSLRVDTLHLNSAGYAAVVSRIVLKIAELQTGGNLFLTTKNAIGLFENRKQFELATGGVYKINGLNVIYVPDQSVYPGNIAFGDGLKKLSHSTAFEGYYNTVAGVASGGLITTGYFNAGFGYNALRVNTTGYQNMAFGANSLFSNTIGRDLVAIGNNALYTNVSNNASVAIGTNALFTNAADNNTAIGFYAANMNASGTGITAVGFGALYYSLGNYNTAIGANALYNQKTGTNNVAIGRVAMEGSFNASNVSNNTAIGYGAGRGLLTGGDNNTFLGNLAATLATTATYGIAIGSNINLQSNTASGQLTIANAIFGTGNSATNVAVSTGNIGFYVTAPTARVHLPVGAAGANQAPLKLSTGVTKQTTTEQGAVNWDGTRLYIGSAATPVNQTVAYLSDTTTQVLAYRAITAATTILATDATIDITAGSFTQPLPTTALTTGQVINLANSGAGTVTVTGTNIMGQASILLQPGSTLTVQYKGTSGTYLIL